MFLRWHLYTLGWVDERTSCQFLFLCLMAVLFPCFQFSFLSSSLLATILQKYLNKFEPGLFLVCLLSSNTGYLCQVGDLDMVTRRVIVGHHQECGEGMLAVRAAYLEF